MFEGIKKIFNLDREKLKEKAKKAASTTAKVALTTAGVGAAGVAAAQNVENEPAKPAQEEIGPKETIMTATDIASIRGENRSDIYDPGSPGIEPDPEVDKLSENEKKWRITLLTFLKYRKLIDDTVDTDEFLALSVNDIKEWIRQLDDQERVGIIEGLGEKYDLNDEKARITPELSKREKEGRDIILRMLHAKNLARHLTNEDLYNMPGPELDKWTNLAYESKGPSEKNQKEYGDILDESTFDSRSKPITVGGQKYVVIEHTEEEVDEAMYNKAKSADLTYDHIEWIKQKIKDGEVGKKIKNPFGESMTIEKAE